MALVTVLNQHGTDVFLKELQLVRRDARVRRFSHVSSLQRSRTKNHQGGRQGLHGGVKRIICFNTTPLK
jgi:hypothetical protein